MNILQKKLDFLLDKYAVDSKAILSADNKTVEVNGRSYALLPWRYERRFIELKKIVDTTVGNISHFKIMSINPSTSDLNYIVKRELDIAEYVSSLKITEVFKAENDDVASVICMTESGAVFTLEIAANLDKDCEVIDKHEIITDRGTACDRAVDSQTPLYSVYVYGKKREEYTDVDFELYGLSVYEISVVRAALDIAKNIKLGEENDITNARLDMLAEKAAESARLCENISV